MTRAISELMQAAAALWLIPTLPLVAAVWFLGWWGLYMLGWVVVWFTWLKGSEHVIEGDTDIVD